jgi:rhodanese-related sulfurtransferase
MNFSEYLTAFDYHERNNMRINIKELLPLLEQKKVQIIDIRFADEAKAWGFDFIKNIPLNELPKRLDELDKRKIIVTACPHSDRSSLARHFLTLNGFTCKYLSDGLMGLAYYFRCETARDFIIELSK